MQFATLYVLREDVPLAALALARASTFEPAISDVASEDLPELPGTVLRERFHSASIRVEKLLALYNIDFATLAAPLVQAVTEQDLVQADNWLGETWGTLSQQQETLRQQEEEINHYQALLKSLDAFAKLDINLGLLRKNRRFLDLRVGSISNADVTQLSSALGLANYVMQVYHEEGGQSHCMIAGPKGHEDDLLRLLNSAGWHTLEVPQEFSGHPDQVRARLKVGLATAISNHTQTSNQFALAQDKLRLQLVETAHLIHHAAPHAELAEQMRAKGGLAVVSGWVPGDRIAALRDALAFSIGNRYQMTQRPPNADELHQVPSLTRQAHWLRPFTALVTNYGVPRYTEIDPTPLFALTFTAMFGMMFGDIGHGALIVLTGLLVRRLAFARPLLLAAGASSMLFGWLYGSIFGYEAIIHPLWISPLSDPMRMLTAALYWGMGFILLSTLLTIYNRIAQGELAAALFSASGVAGILTYLAALYVGYRLSTGQSTGLVDTLILLLPLGTLMWHLWVTHPGPLSERLLVVVVETFETVLNYISNTLSFLRVAAFSMNHVALAVAVFALAGMMGSTGHLITVVLGNLFILILEGAIVTIQVLRLEYYEGFSRFYSGDGRAFRPLTQTSPGGSSH